MAPRARLAAGAERGRPAGGPQDGARANAISSAAPCAAAAPEPSHRHPPSINHPRPCPTALRHADHRQAAGCAGGGGACGDDRRSRLQAGHGLLLGPGAAAAPAPARGCRGERLGCVRGGQQCAGVGRRRAAGARRRGGAARRGAAGLCRLQRGSGAYSEQRRGWLAAAAPRVRRRAVSSWRSAAPPEPSAHRRRPCPVLPCPAAQALTKAYHVMGNCPGEHSFFVCFALKLQAAFEPPAAAGCSGLVFHPL